jgi:CO/xanthine dehydrogenase Mo-binding subunit
MDGFYAGGNLSRRTASSGPRAKEADNKLVGQPVPRVDARAKVTGRAKYVADVKMGGMLYGKMLLSPHAHALITGIDARRAEELPGVWAVVTAQHVPGENQIGVILSDQPLLAQERVLWVGDCVALVAAESESIAEQARDLIEVSYEPLPRFDAPEDALEGAGPELHPGGNIHTHLKIRKGDIAQGFEKSDIILEQTYQTQRQEHAYLETIGVLATPQGDGSLTVLGSIQCPFYVQKGVARVLGLPLSKVRVVQATTGGAFGGKEDVPSEICAFASLLALKTQRPVRMVLSREEDLRRSSKRHPMAVTYKMGATKEGQILSAQIRVLADTGAYATISPVVLYRSTVHAAGPYDIPHIRVDTYGVYTNSTPNGAFRGFGTPQVTFAHESMVDELAISLQMDPIHIRLLNGLKLGSQTATGQVLSESVGYRETIVKAREASQWDQKRAADRRAGPLRRRGVGVSTMFYGVSLGAKGWFLDAAAASVQMHQDGSVSIAFGCTEMGQGAQTVIAQMAAESTGLPIERITILPTDTGLVPDSGPTVASRTTVFSGNAVLDALGQIKHNLLKEAAELLAVDPGDLVFRDGQVRGGGKSIPFDQLIQHCYQRNVNLAAEGWYISPPCTFDEQSGQGDAYYVYGYGTQIAEVEVDLDTGRVEVVRMVAAHDVGRAINPSGVRGQIEGGVVQGLGYALLEDFVVKDGQILTPDLATYTIPTALDVPQVESIIVEAASKDGPFGAKGLGEQPIIPTAAAVANAVANATGVRVRKLPISPERLRQAILENDAKTGGETVGEQNTEFSGD